MAKDPKTGREIRDVARERLDKLTKKTNEAKQIRDRQDYERAGGVKRGSR